MPLVYVNPILITAITSEIDTLNVSGITTLGDSPNDNVIINASTISIPNTININNNSLFIDNLANRIGINTNIPSQLFHVNGNAIVSGSLGIGNLSPSYKLHITSLTGQGMSSPFGIEDNGLFAYYPNLGDKNLNMAIVPNDRALIFSGLTVNTGNLFIGVWSNVTGGAGVKLSSSNVDIYGTTNIFGNLSLGTNSTNTITINSLALSIPNNLNIGANALFIDNTNKRIGINTITPSVALDVNGAVNVTGNVVLGTNNTNTIIINSLALSIPNNLNIGANALFIDNTNKRIGINTITPTAPMDIASDTNAFSLGLRGRVSDNMSIIKFKNNDNTHMLRLASSSGLLYVQNGTGLANTVTFDTVNNTTTMNRLNLNEIATNTTDSITFTQGGSSNLLSPSYVGELKTFRVRRTASKAFPYWNLSLPDQTLTQTSYPDYVSYLRSVAIEVPFSSTNIGTNQSDGGDSFTLAAAPLVTPTVGQYIVIMSTTPPPTFSAADMNDFQFRIVTNVSGNTIGVDEKFTMPINSYVHLLNHNNATSHFTGTIISTNVFCLNVTNDSGENAAVHRALFSALFEDYAFSIIGSNVTHSRYAEWGMVASICSGSTWVEASAVERNISSFSVSGSERRITFDGAVLTNGTYTVKFFPYRIINNATSAKHRQNLDVHLASNGLDSISGLRRRDRIQGHRHSISDPGHSHLVYGFNDAVNDAFPTLTGSSQGWVESTAAATTGISVLETSSDTVNGTSRSDQFTRPRGLGVYFYEYMGKVNI